MRKIITILSLACLSLLLNGCTIMTYERAYEPVYTVRTYEPVYTVRTIKHYRPARVYKKVIVKKRVMPRSYRYRTYTKKTVRYYR